MLYFYTPQMKPIFWLNLFITFSLVIFIYLILNYFNVLFIKTSKNLKFNLLFKNLNWKW